MASRSGSQDGSPAATWDLRSQMLETFIKSQGGALVRARTCWVVLVRAGTCWYVLGRAGTCWDALHQTSPPSHSPTGSADDGKRSWIYPGRVRSRAQALIGGEVRGGRSVSLGVGGFLGVPNPMNLLPKSMDIPRRPPGANLSGKLI